MKTLYVKLVLVLSVFVLISTGAVAYCLINIKNQRSDALIINLAGRQRALSQSMGKSVLGLYKAVKSPEGEKRTQSIEAYKSDLLEKKKMFGDTLATLLGGGKTLDGRGNAVVIPRTENPEIRKKIEESEAVWMNFEKELDTLLARTETPDHPFVAEALSYIEANNIPLFKDMNNLTLMFQNESDKKLDYFKMVLYAGIAINLLTFSAVIWAIYRLIISRLKTLHRHMLGITTGDGDLTKRINASAEDEIGVLGHEFNTLLDNVEVIISKLKGSCTLLKKSSERLSSTVTSLAEGLDKQDNRTRQVATAIEEMSSTTIEIARNVSRMAEHAASANGASKKGDSSVKMVVERMSNIADSAKGSVTVISNLGDESQKIGNIVQVINDIADQTNLLALNAAIEAARAGDQGRGFAVVADEVRRLAERTTQATKEIDEMVTGIQLKSRHAVESIEKEAAYVIEGVSLTNEAGSSLNDITASITTVNDMIQQIATSTEEQSTVASNISSDMEAVAGISRDSAESVKTVNQLFEELSGLAFELEESVSKFKVNEKAVDAKKAGEGSKTVVAMHPNIRLKKTSYNDESAMPAAAGLTPEADLQ